MRGELWQTQFIFIQAALRQCSVHTLCRGKLNDASNDLLLFHVVQGFSPDRLMQVKLPIVDMDVCNQPQYYGGLIDDTMQCAGVEEGEVSPCHVRQSLQSHAVSMSHGVKQTLRLYSIYRPIFHRNNIWRFDVLSTEFDTKEPTDFVRGQNPLDSFLR